MAKNKKSTKAAKKPIAKSKPSTKAKKAVPAKAKKAAKKPVPKKAAPKKVVSKKPIAKKPISKKATTKVVTKIAVASVKKVTPSKKIIKKQIVAKPFVVAKPIVVAKPVPKAVATKKPTEKPKPIAIKPIETVIKPPSPQLKVFQMPTQRPIAHKPAHPGSNSDDRTRYSENELNEFEILIKSKLEKSRDEYRILKESLNRNNDEGTDSTSGGNTKVLEDGAETAEKENLSQLAGRQQKYIMNLENALIRIKNGTYGICSVTGKLISKERLIAVPHTTQSIEAKMMQND